MNSFAQRTSVSQRLNHVEFVHRPGERALVRALFDLLGFQTIEMWENEIVIGIVDPPMFDERDNDNYLAGREVRPEQWALDQALAEALQSEPLAGAFENYQAALSFNPQWGMHFGIKLDTLARWEAAVARFAELDTHAPALQGRARLIKVFRPEDADQRASALYQAFLWTDVIASGSLALGQRIEFVARA